MSSIRILPEVPLNEKRLQEDLGEEIFLEIILKNNIYVMEGMLESFEPGMFLSLDGCVVIDQEGEYRCHGITKAPFIWKRIGIKTIAESVEKNERSFDFRGILYKNNMIAGNLNDATSCRVFQMIRLFLDKRITIDEFMEFKKKMEKEEKELDFLRSAKIIKKMNKKESG